MSWPYTANVRDRAGIGVELHVLARNPRWAAWRPGVLQRVENGETITITITKHGREVAKLVPIDRKSTNPEDVIAALRTARKGLRRGRHSVQRMIDEGRP